MAKATKLIIKKEAKASCSNKVFTAQSNELSDLRKLLRLASLSAKL